MLAAVKLGQSYKLEMPKISQESNIQEKYTTELAEVAELRQLDRLGAAKQRWRSLLEKLPQEKQLALSQYANEQNWFELGVDGSIIAKLGIISTYAYQMLTVNILILPSVM